MPHALIVDDDDGFQAAVAEVVREFGFSVDQADSLRAARGLIERRSPDVALVDLALPDGRGSELFVELSEGSDVVMITGNATLDSAVQALREGATDYLVKPVDLQRLRAVLKNVARRSELREEVDNLRAELMYDDGLVVYLNGQEIHRSSMPAGAVSAASAVIVIRKFMVAAVPARSIDPPERDAAESTCSR